MEQDLPDTPPELPAAPMDRAQQKDPNSPAAKALRRAKLQRDLIGHRTILRQQIVTLFDKIPFDEQKLREQAKQIVRDGIEIDRLAYKIKAHLEGEEGDRQGESSEPSSDGGSLLPGCWRWALAVFGPVSHRTNAVKVTGTITYPTS